MAPSRARRQVLVYQGVEGRDGAVPEARVLLTWHFALGTKKPTRARRVVGRNEPDLTGWGSSVIL